MLNAADDAAKQTMSLIAEARCREPFEAAALHVSALWPILEADALLFEPFDLPGQDRATT